MPASATGTLFVLASGFGIGALVIFAAFAFLIEIGDINQHASHAGGAIRRQRTGSAPAPRRSPLPTRQRQPCRPPPDKAPAPANPQTPKAPTAQQQQNKQ